MFRCSIIVFPLPSLGACAERFDCAIGFCATMELEDALSFSAESSNITEDDIPGPGRLLGKVYTGLGRRIEIILSLAARFMGRGPAPVAARIKDLRRYPWLPVPDRETEEKLKKECKALVKYTRYI